MITANSEWLLELPEKYKDAEWLEEHADGLYNALAEALRDAQSRPQALDSLLLIFPYLLNREDLKRWAKLIQRALRVSQVEVRDPRSEQPEHRVGSMFVLIEQEKNFIPAKKRRRERISPRQLFEIYISLLMSQVYNRSNSFRLEHIDGLLEFARRVNSPRLYYKLYQAMAFIYVQYSHYDKAIDRAQMAYTYWHDKGDALETALSAYAMAEAYRGKQEWTQATKWLETAADYFAKLDYPRQHGVIALERSCLYAVQEDYEPAIQWAEIALREFETLNMPYHVALAYHALGTSQGYINQLEDAHANLETALDMWQEQSNPGQHVYTQHALAFVEAKMGDTTRALQRLNDNLEQLQSLPDNEWRRGREERTHRLIEAIENGEDLDNLTAAD